MAKIDFIGWLEDKIVRCGAEVEELFSQIDVHLLEFFDAHERAGLVRITLC